MNPISLLINSITSALLKALEGAPDQPPYTKLKDFLQRSYKRKNADAQLMNGINRIIENYEYPSFITYVCEKPELANQIACLVIAMPDPDSDRIPLDLLRQLRIPEHSAYSFASLLFQVRSELLNIGGYSDALCAVDELSRQEPSQSLQKYVQSLEDELINSVEIRSGPATIVASGTVIGFNGNPIEITYGPRTERLTLILVFIDDESSKARVNPSTPNPNTLRLELHNFRSPIGSGTTKPIPIGTLLGKPLSIHYRVYDIGEGDKTVHYTIYQEEVS